LDVLSTASGKKKNKGLSLDRTTFVVLDEADKMLQMGFEQQVRQIIRNVRPDRQTLMLSATMGRKMEKVAQDWLANPVRISVGRTGQASEHVEQHVMVLPTVEKKNDWLLEMLPVLEDVGRALIFVATRDGCEELAKLVHSKYGDNITVETLHGDKHQSDRNVALKLFSKGAVKFLIATDVAARGLDVPLVSTVINYDAAKDLDAHVHRVGRAGRLSSTDGQWQSGTAYTLLLQGNKRDADFAHTLLNAFEREGHGISPQLQQLAYKSRKAGNVESRKTRNKKGLGFDSFLETDAGVTNGPSNARNIAASESW
jgi:ATP-dependent RNA helicase DDX42